MWDPFDPQARTSGVIRELEQVIVMLRKMSDHLREVSQN
jgi:hypothetical protein